jgi:hypothetical protein
MGMSILTLMSAIELIRTVTVGPGNDVISGFDPSSVTVAVVIAGALQTVTFVSMFPPVHHQYATIQGRLQNVSKCGGVDTKTSAY